MYTMPNTDISYMTHNNRGVVVPERRVEFYLYPTVGTVLIHSVKPELTE